MGRRICSFSEASGGREKIYLHKMLNISNEPENWWDWWKGRKICEGYKIVRQKLDAAHIDIPLAGPEYMSDYSYTKNWHECKPYIGIFETHNYDDSHKIPLHFVP